VVFDLGTLLTRFFGISSSAVPGYMVQFALSNFLGPLLLGRLFDTVGRIPMISFGYLASAAMVVLIAVLLRFGLTVSSFMIPVMVTFFLDSGRGELGLPDRQRGRPDGDPGLAIALF
jgi:MFS family permease